MKNMEKYIAIVLLVASLTSAEKKQCQEISIPMCKGIGYNYTYMPNEFNHDSQDEAGLEVHQFWPLVEIQCSPDLKFFLCSMYAPICMENYKPHLPACRSVCERAKSGCAPLMRQYGFVWPERMDCSKLPYYGEKGKLCMDRNITDSSSTDRPLRPGSGQKTTRKPLEPAVTDNKDVDIINPNTNINDWNKNPNFNDIFDPYKKIVEDHACTCKCRLQSIQESSQYYNKVSSGGVKNCGMNCTSPFLSDDEKTFATFWIGLWSIMCCISTSITLLTFVLDMTRFKYPERPIIFLTGCYLMVSIGYIIRLVVGHENVACDGSMIRYSTTGPASCVSTFLLVYFFGMASSIWWVILAFTWFLSAGLKWGSEAIASYSQYFHFAAWLIPSVKSIAVLAMSSVDGDPVSGICYVGNQNINNLRGFVLIPLFVYLIIGSTFLIAGFVSLFRIRSVIKHQNGGKIEKLERLMIRIGVFSLLYTIPATIVLACYFYEQYLKDDWEKSVICPCSEKSSKPDFAVFMLKYFMLLVVGITSGFWIWTGKTLETWKKLCNGSLCCANSDYAYSRPPIKYSPTSNSAVSSLHKPPVSHC
ncbi:frizzled-5-like [Ruditapes philippinarum]|uniref:frizzled-5-like n=1 Tax=Ruditapes philippinarum TaxID=129788 RepID=UPI00295AAAFA|nr:frizzled-5-like [Ruditapes philippinarum]XP_060582143.1 frizzled-5-like [Ruditapes philippinarum]XP_060582144.1 frizzled-5-like [Ruditapes philippinarum]XP_060582145.1 frizzled-5-like [Ruditapes philippinarum]XP_060582146.1 frizzled-5-like [Ruditapes philippinarum]